MGFKVPRKTALLQFEGDEFKGCEIRVALDLTFESQLHMTELKEAGDQRAILTLFANAALVDWNLVDDDDQPIKMTATAFLELPGWFGMLVLNHWGDALTEASQIAGPLGKQSKNGNTTEEPSAEMEASLSSQSS